MNALFLNVRQKSRLTFWRITAFLIDHAVRHKHIVHRIWPYLPLIAYGLIAYLVGLLIGGIVKALLI
jgi:hypothetical protein